MILNHADLDETELTESNRSVQVSEDELDDPHAGVHCEDCANAAAAAAGGDGEGEVGEGNGSVAGGQGDKRDAVDGEGGGGAHMNPFACMLNPEKIQALETHKNSAVAKRSAAALAALFLFALLRWCATHSLKVQRLRGRGV